MIVTDLALLLPVLEIFDLTTTADVHVLAAADEHVGGGHHVSDGRLARIVSSYPHRDRDVVSRATVGDREEPMEAEQQLRPAVVICCRKGERGETRRR